MCRPIGNYLFCRIAFQGKCIISIVLSKLGNQTQLGKHVLVARFGMGNVAVGAILNALLQVHEVASALVAKSVQRAATKHTVEIVPIYLMAGEVFTGIIFEICTAVFHSCLLISATVYYLLLYYISHIKSKSLDKSF